MTSGKLYLAKWYENCKRRNWTFLLCAVMFFLFQPVLVAINLTSSYSNLQEKLANGLVTTAGSIWKQELQDSFLRMCCYSEEIYILVVGFAVLFAVQGFSWIYNRKKMDFYMSVPVSSVKRYLMIMGNGIAVFGAVYLLCEIICMGISAGFGLFSMEVLAQMLLSWFVTMLIFTAIYQVALAAVMLTGNVLTALLGCCVFFLYEPLVRLVFDQLKATYFVTYCRTESYQFQNMPYLTPVANAFQFTDRISISAGKLLGTPYGEEFSIHAAVGLQILIMLISIAVWGSIAYLLFRKRKTESYGSAIAFRTAKGLIRFFLLVPCSVVAGMLASIWAGDSLLFLWGGAAMGLLLGHAVIQLIYERDLRAIKKRLFSLGCSGAISALVLAVFCFDLTGYDHYVPELDDVVSVSVTVENDYSGLGRRYKVPFDGSRSELENMMLEEMCSGDPATIQAVLSMADAYVEQLECGNEDYGTIVSEENDFHCWIVRYELKNGREVYRRFYSDAVQMTDQINTVMRDASYQNLRCQLFDQAFAEDLDQMKIIYSNGVQGYLYTMDKETLYQAFAEEMKTYDYSLISENLPKGKLSFTIPRQDEPGKNLCTWDFPVYASFEKTLALIGENGIPAWEETGLQAEDVDSIQVDYYYYADEESNDVRIFGETATMEEAAVEEQNLSITIEDEEEIRILLDALYSQELMDVIDSTIHRYQEFAYDFDVKVSLSSTGKQKRLDVPYMMLLKEKIPAFVIERLKDAAVTE